eukprot:CAMPEP_0185163888 /NCGR_PEP_ID=MMETSP1139-20130426/8630_1 /TAXON_ID=298111 /ORGANISM="Pavlova sp., Strain CCMP459" /LENGTH=40 /DNA_ID= /DNA_START= /DNA_END= /DNA_ORIENTATION=
MAWAAGSSAVMRRKASLGGSHDEVTARGRQGGGGDRDLDL